MTFTPRISEETKAAVIRDYRIGLRANDIADRHSVPAATVYYHAIKAGLRPRKLKRPRGMKGETLRAFLDRHALTVLLAAAEARNDSPTGLLGKLAREVLSDPVLVDNLLDDGVKTFAEAAE